MIEEEFDFNKFIKSLAVIDDKKNAITEEYKPRKRLELKSEKVFTILNDVRKKITVRKKYC